VGDINFESSDQYTGIYIYLIKKKKSSVNDEEEKRRELMESWAAFATKMKADVITLRTGKKPG